MFTNYLNIFKENNFAITFFFKNSKKNKTNSDKKNKESAAKKKKEKRTQTFPYFVERNLFQFKATAIDVELLMLNF